MALCYVEAIELQELELLSCESLSKNELQQVEEVQLVPREAELQGYGQNRCYRFEVTRISEEFV